MTAPASHRLPTGGRLIDRDRPVRFTFDGHPLTGLAGDTLASALLAHGVMLQGRSFKYHRPRGPVTAGPEEPNALMGLGDGARFEPNARATVTPLAEGLAATSQNRWPSLGFDIGAINDRLAKFLPAGFYYKTFLAPRHLWKYLYEPIIRRAAGLGRAPTLPDADRYEQIYAFADVLVAGGGIAGLTAARAAAEAGARVILCEQSPHWGGRAPVDGVEIDGQLAGDWVAATVAALQAMPHVTLRLNTAVAAVHDHGYVLADERPAPAVVPAEGAPRQRLWRIRAARIIAATGAIERPLAFAGNDVPGVMLASAMRDLAVNWAVAPGRRIAVVTNNDDGWRTALVLAEGGVTVAAVIDARDDARGPLVDAVRTHGIPIRTGTGIERVHGRKRVRAVTLCRQSGAGDAITSRIPCDALAVSGGWSPAVHLWSHCGGRLIWDDARAMFRPDPARGPTGHDGGVFVIPAGCANGTLCPAETLADAHAAGSRAASETGHTTPATPAPTARPEEMRPILPVWCMPERAGPALRSGMFLDFQNDVKVTDIELAAREGFESVEHAKRYTTLGMATDQGKLSNINGLAILAAAQGAGIPDTGTTTFRPPWTPLTLGAIAGEAAGPPLFQPLRKTPLHARHEARGATWEPVGQWRRPYAYPMPGESVPRAVVREIRNTRQTVGILDASTLGKLLVRGPDAGRFLDMLYTNTMSTLPPGRCRYGAMCTENGFVFDDGVVARIDAQTWLCHTTSGGAERVHGWMEDWLQCEWWDWRVHVVNLTEQVAQIAVAGPNARRLLERLGGAELAPDRLAHMHWTDGRPAGIPARIFRVSFSGELGFELAVAASDGQKLWDTLMAKGAEFGIMPYGTEALHVMRAEKGFIMIGDETDGTVTPGDVGLPVGRKKADFLGKRGLERSHLADPDRWRLVGLETLTGSVLPTGAYATSGGYTPNGQRAAEGRVTSSYYSPTLGRGIALGLVRRGPDRMGEVLTFPCGQASQMRARIVSPVFYDPEGGRLNG